MSEALATVVDGAPARVLSPGKNRFLRYWSLNMTLARSTGQGAFPGFSYTDDEWARMDVLAGGITRPIIAAIITPIAEKICGSVTLWVLRQTVSSSPPITPTTSSTATAM